MVAKYGIEPIKEFVDNLSREIVNISDLDYDYYDNIDAILKLILLNNGCKLKDNTTQHTTELQNSLILCFIIGGQGNDYNKLYDVVSFNGSTYFVIFLDDFKDIRKSESQQSNLITTEEDIFGKSLYFINIKTLTEIFIKLTTNPILFTADFSSTSVGYNLKINPLIVAGFIINEVCGDLTENDIEGCGLHLKDLKQYISHINLSLCGIRNRNDR